MLLNNIYLILKKGEVFSAGLKLAAKTRTFVDLPS